MKLLKTISSIIYAILIAFLILVATGTALSVVRAPNGVRLFVVLSGSMEPSIKTASVVLVAPQDEYSQDDVITFFANPNETDLKTNGTTVTHRIMEAKDDQGNKSYQTKGDANEDTDRETVSHRSILGKVLFSLPYLGYLINFTKTQTGFILLIVIPATLIIYSELISIKKEIVEMIRKSKAKKESKAQGKKVIKKPIITRPLKKSHKKPPQNE